MSGSESEMDEAAVHSKSIKRLKSKDPDFYEFLKENDQELLNFRDSDDEPDDEEETASDEDESEDRLSPEKIAYIKKHIHNKPTIKLCKELMSAFKYVADQASGTAKESDMSHSELFNDVFKLCIVELVPGLNKVMCPDSDDEKKKKEPRNSKLWKTSQKSIKYYLIKVLKMLSIMKDKSVLSLMLKHVVNLMPYYSAFVKLTRNLVKKMISFWSTEEETVRVLAMFVIIKSTKKLSKEYLNSILKEMYFAYIKNTKFTSPNTWPMINFMKRSLTEIYTLNPEMAYEHGFLYIRQMSIHLRNALTTKKKESFQAVYNWQYTHCILFWCNLLCRLSEHESIKSLLYPLIQTMIGTINLIPSAKYFPLRFHFIRAFIDISETTGVFVPVIPFILDVLKITKFNEKCTFSVKPVDFNCAVKVTKSQLSEAGFKDACINEVCALIANYLKVYSNSIGFPELALPVVLQFKSFMKNSKVSKYNQQLKVVLVKVEENVKFITEKRRMVKFGITDNEQIKKWEKEVLSENPPLLKLKLENIIIIKKEDVSDDEEIKVPRKKKRKNK